MPDKISKAPRTPKAGSTLVSRTMGWGVVEADSDAEGELVGVGVYVTLKEEVYVVVIATFLPRERVEVVSVPVVVVTDRETLG
jgi:hypothetical protein